METHDPPEVRVGRETETSHGWSYEVAMCWPGGGVTDHTVTLSWSDHDLLTGGVVPPSHTVRAALRLVRSLREPKPPLPSRVDVATLRRRIPEFDERLRSLL